MTYEEALQKYIEGCQKIHDKHKAMYFPSVPYDTVLEIKAGKRYDKIVAKEYVKATGQSNVGGSVHSFVEKSTGNVFKPAGWNAPAKHARGNIYDEANGLGMMGPYGPASLK